MKVEIPDQLKADVPQNNFGKMLAATPVVMAVIATLLAGLASSEMTRAQYDRALAAQQSQVQTELTVQQTRIHNELFQLLTPEQQTKMKEMIAQREARMAEHMQQHEPPAAPEQ